MISFNHSCKFPCEFLGSFNNQKEELLQDQYPDVQILSFRGSVEKHQSKYIYTEVDLFAALGGYLGSFLGISLLQFSDLFAILLRKVIHSNVSNMCQDNNAIN